MMFSPHEEIIYPMTAKELDEDNTLSFRVSSSLGADTIHEVYRPKKDTTLW